MKLFLLALLAAVALAAPDGHHATKKGKMDGKCGPKAKMMRMMKKMNDPLMMAKKKKDMMMTMHFMEFFPASGPEDTCSNVPEELMQDPIMTCGDKSKGDEHCICMKIPEPELAPMMEEMGAKLPDIVNTETGFVRKCGKCHDPCELKWYPEMPEMDMEEKMAMNMLFMGHMAKKMSRKMKGLKSMAKKMGKEMGDGGLLEFMMSAMKEKDDDMMDMVKELMGGKGKDKKKSMMDKIPKEVKALLRVAMDIMREADSSEEEDSSEESDEEDEDDSMEECNMIEDH